MISETELTGCALTVTLILPVVAVSGTIATSCVVELLTSFAVTPLMVTMFCVLSALKLVPVMITGYPTPIIDGANPLIESGDWVAMTVNEPWDKTVVPFIVTDIGEPPAPAGTMTVSSVAVADSTVAVTVPNFTVFPEAVELKPVPLIIILAPMVSCIDVMLVICNGIGAGGSGAASFLQAARKQENVKKKQMQVAIRFSFFMWYFCAIYLQLAIGKRL